MMRIDCLASSSKANAYRVDDGATALLLECGLPWKELQKRLNFKTSELAACLVTHYHKDHARAILEALKYGLNIYASQETLDYCKITHHRAHPIVPLKQFQIGTWTGVAFPTVHDAAGSVGYLLQSGREKLLFLTDTAYVRYRFKGLTHIMIEANFSLELININLKHGTIDPSQKSRLLKTHLSIERVIDLLKINDLTAVEEIHLLHLSADNSNAELFKRMVQEAVGKATYVAGE